MGRKAPLLSSAAFWRRRSPRPAPCRQRLREVRARAVQLAAAAHAVDHLRAARPQAYHVAMCSSPSDAQRCPTQCGPAADAQVQHRSQRNLRAPAGPHVRQQIEAGLPRVAAALHKAQVRQHAVHGLNAVAGHRSERGSPPRLVARQPAELVTTDVTASSPLRFLVQKALKTGNSGSSFFRVRRQSWCLSLQICLISVESRVETLTLLSARKTGDFHPAELVAPAAGPGVVPATPCSPCTSAAYQPFSLSRKTPGSAPLYSYALPVLPPGFPASNFEAGHGAHGLGPVLRHAGQRAVLRRPGRRRERGGRKAPPARTPTARPAGESAARGAPSWWSAASRRRGGSAGQSERGLSPCIVRMCPSKLCAPENGRSCRGQPWI